MKKVLNIFVLVTFLISYIGVNIHKHYAQGELCSTSFFSEEECCCTTDTNIDSSNDDKACDHGCSCENSSQTIRLMSIFIAKKNSQPSIDVLSLGYINICKSALLSPISNPTESLVYSKIHPLTHFNIQSLFGVFIC